MKHIVWNAYYNHEKEENWINEMSDKGFAFTAYSWFRYVFTETPNNEYTYRIELLDKLPSHPKSVAYLKFLEDSGVEFVASKLRWVYLRKKSSEGPFDIYTDIESKIKYYKKINVFWTSLMWLEFLAVFINIVDGINRTNFLNINLMFAVPLFLIGVKFWSLGVPIRRNIKKLKKEKAIRE